jgi:prolipoprotein diacylglyceryltransferase
MTARTELLRCTGETRATARGVGLREVCQRVIDHACGDPVWFRIGDVIVVKFGIISATVAFVGMCACTLFMSSVGIPLGFVHTWLLASIVALLLGSIVVGKLMDLFRPAAQRRAAAGKIAFTFFGGFLGVTAVTLAMAWHWGLPFARCTDAMLVSVPFFHGLSRLACLNYGCCCGREMTHPGRIHVTYHHEQSKAVRVLGLRGVPLYPVQLYELTGNLVLGGVLLILWFGVGLEGLVSAVYLMGYVVLRTLADRYRSQTDSHEKRAYHGYLSSLALTFGLGGIAILVLAIVRAAPLTPVFRADHWAAVAGIVPFALALSALMALTYGVHFRRIGRWF